MMQAKEIKPRTLTLLRVDVAHDDTKFSFFFHRKLTLEEAAKAKIRGSTRTYWEVEVEGLGRLPAQAHPCFTEAYQAARALAEQEGWPVWP